MTEETAKNVIGKERYNTYNTPQRLFVGFTLAVLVDLTVLNLFEEYWAYVTIHSFTISLLAAMLLQALLKLSIKAEHAIASYFKSKPGLGPKVYRWISSYAVLVIAKLVMLGAINQLFGDQVKFTGPFHGLVAFIVVIFAIIIAEALIGKIY